MADAHLDPRVHRRPRRLAARGGRGPGASCPPSEHRDGRRPLLRDGPRQALGAHRARARGDPRRGGRARRRPGRSRRGELRARRRPTSSSSRSSSPAAPRLEPATDSADLLQLPARPGPPAVTAAARARRRPDDDDPVRGGHRRHRSRSPSSTWRTRSPRRSREPGIRQLHAAETEKYAHVTYFFNGGEEAEWAGETRILVPSPRDVAELRPEAGDVCRRCRRRGRRARCRDGYGFCVVNFANPDMVGHTGVIPAVVRAVETADAAPRPGRRGHRTRSAASASSPPTTATPSRCSRPTASALTRPTRRTPCRSCSPCRTRRLRDGGEPRRPRPDRPRAPRPARSPRR